MLMTNGQCRSFHGHSLVIPGSFLILHVLGMSCIHSKSVVNGKDTPEVIKHHVVSGNELGCALSSMF